MSSNFPALDVHLRVLAGPGTGKTHNLVDLYGGLVESGRAGRGEVLVLTFSTSAAAEIERRVDERLRDSYDRAWISTFHGFCARLLRDHRPDPRRLVMSGFQEWAAMRHTLDGMDAGRLGPLSAVRGSDAFARDALAFVALLKQNLVGPQEFVLRAEVGGDARMRGLAAVYAEYQRVLGAAGLADFRDLVGQAIDLLRSSTAVLDELRARFRFVLVDEFQDVDPAQFVLLRLLAPPDGPARIAVVGDPDQSIYAFRGTVPTLMTTDFGDLYRPEEGALETSRRCPPAVLEAAERLLRATHRERRERELRSTRDAVADRVVTVREANGVDEAFWVAREIRRLVVEEGRRPGEFAILLRSTTALAAPFEEALRAVGVPHEVRGKSALARNEVVRFALAYLAALADPDVDTALERLLDSALSGVDRRTVGRLRRHALEEGRTFRRVLRRVLFRMAARDPERWPLGGGAEPGEGREPDFMARMSDAELDALHSAVAVFDGLRLRARELPVAALAYAVLVDAGVIGRVLTLDIDEEVRVQALSDLRAAVAAFEELEVVGERLTGTRPLLAEIGAEVGGLVARAMDDTEAAGAVRDAVQVLTVHQAKGLEFPFVFVSAFAQGIFPVADRPHPLLDGDAQAWLDANLGGFRPAWPRTAAEHVEEEARLAYVAMTRASERLYLTFADEYAQPAGPSPFVDLAVPGAVPLAMSRQVTAPDPTALLTRAEAETALATCELDAAARERAVNLGVDLEFVLDPASGTPFDPSAEPPSEVLPTHFSATAINDWLKCPRIYWYNHHPGLAAPGRSVEMERGSFLHEVLENFHAREAEWRHLPVEDQRQWLEAELEARIADYLDGVEGVLERRTEERRLRGILDNYVRFATSSQPIRRLGTIATEVKFTLDLDGAEVRGKIDRINDTGDGTCEVVDYKTGRGWGADRTYASYFGPEMADVQLALYWMACRDGVGPDGEPIGLEPRYLSLWYPRDRVFNSMRQVLFAVGGPQPGLPAWLQKPIGAEELERGRATVQRAIDGIRGGDFRPRPREGAVGTCLSWFGCPHSAVCPYGGQPR